MGVKSDSNSSGNTIPFDPRQLIAGPYINCPVCSQQTFGVLYIDGKSYMRRCNRFECWHFQSYPLWPLEKKVIYIDQFGISNMMKALNPATKGHARAVGEPLWMELFETLDRLCKLQLVICPDSDDQKNESLAAPFYKPLKRVYELLSHGVSFMQSSEIERFQLVELARQWIAGEPLGCTLDPQTVTSSGLHDWQSRFIVSVDADYSDRVDGIRTAREGTHEQLRNLFDLYHAECKTYDEWLAHEASFCGKIHIDACMEWRRTMKAMQEGSIPLDVNAAMPPNSIVLLGALIQVFREAGLSQADAEASVLRFLTSDAPAQAPLNRICCSLYASLAVKAGAGQKEYPNQGTATDIGMISSLMPYCDAMFIDGKSRALLQDIPKTHRLPYKTQVFSPKTGQDFLEYLREIERNAPTHHMKQVESVYGSDCGQPYTAVFRQ